MTGTTWVWLVVGLLIVVALWEVNRWLAAALVALIALYHLGKAG